MFTTSKKLLNAATALTIGATAIAIVFGTAPATAQSASPPFASPAPAIFNDARTDFWLGDAQPCRNGIWAAELKALDQSIDEMQNYINRVQSLIDAYPQDSSRLGGEPTAAIGGDQRIQDLLRSYRNGLWGWQQMLKQMKAWWQELVQKNDCKVEVPSTPMTQGYVPAPQTPSVLHLPDPTPQVFEPPVRIEDSFDNRPKTDESKTDEPKTDEPKTNEPVAPRSDRGEEQKSQTSEQPAQETETGKTTGTTSKTTNQGKPSTANQGKPNTRTSSNTGSQKPATNSKPNSVKTHQPSGTHIGGMRTAGMRTSGFAGMHGGGMRLGNLGGMRMSGLGGMHLGGMGFGGLGRR